MEGQSQRSAHYPSLDGLRALAALMVAYGHAGYFGWVPPVVGGATIGVVLFFFLSGFLMGRHYFPDVSLGIFTGGALRYWLSFLLRRFARVYPPYLFAPLLGYLLLMPSLPPDFRPAMPAADPSIVDTLRKLAFLKGELGIYWTIKLELFFYLLYPFFIALCLLFRWKGTTLFLLWLALIFFNHFPHGIGNFSWRVPLPGLWTGYISVFVAGILAAVVADRIPSSFGGKSLPWNGLALAGFATFAAVVALVSRSQPTQQFIWKLEWLFAGLFFVMFTSLIRSDGLVSRLLSSRFGVVVGQASYSLYLIHIIAFKVVSNWLPHRYQGAVAAILVLLVMTSAYYMLFERPFVRLSKRIAVKGRDRRTPGSGSQLTSPVSPD